MPPIVENLVSTIIPVYNRPKMVVEAVESVLAQTYRPVEIIVSDDGSTDETPAVLDQLAADRPDTIRVVHSPNRGAGPAREAARQLARGEFIQYLDSDDLLRPRKFEIMVEALREHPECGAAYGYICLHPADGSPIAEPFKWSGRTLPALFPWLLVDRWWNTDCPLWRRSVCDAIGPWSDFKYSQDWEHDGRAGALGTRLVHCKEFVCDQREPTTGRQTRSGKWLDPHDRKRFMGLMLSYAMRAGVTCDAPEMQHFSRWLFFTARLCGAAGLAGDSKEAFEWAKEAAGPARSRGGDFRAYSLTARVIGWSLTARVFRAIEKTFRRGPGQATLKQCEMPER